MLRIKCVRGNQDALIILSILHLLICAKTIVITKSMQYFSLKQPCASKLPR